MHDLTCLRFPELCTPDTLEYPDLIRRALRRGATIHTVSDFVADEVRDAFGVPERSGGRHPQRRAVPPAAGPGTDADGRAGASPERDRYILAVGTIEPRKDLPLLVDAFGRLDGGLGRCAW